MSGTKQRPTFIKTDFQHIGGVHAGIAADPDVEKHRAVRKVLAPAFNPRALKEQEPALHEHMDRFIRKLGEDGSKEEGLDMRHVSDLQKEYHSVADDCSGLTGWHAILPVTWHTVMIFIM